MTLGEILMINIKKIVGTLIVLFIIIGKFDKSYGEHKKDICRFIRECGYFFLATSDDDAPHLRPMGMIYADNEALYIATDKRKNVYRELMENPQVELASYSLSSRKWVRIRGRMMAESSLKIKEEMSEMYPMLHQEYAGEEEVLLIIFKLLIGEINMY